jgi:hypothetical protein
MRNAFTIDISTGNGAFDDDAGAEVARILRDVADRIERGTATGKVFDINGNRVGSFELQRADD